MFFWQILANFVIWHACSYVSVITKHLTNHAPSLRSTDPLSHLPTVNGGDSVSLGASWRMRALFGYNPVTDSPNENKEEELCIEEGDIVSVFGKPDEDGYYQVV